MKIGPRTRDGLSDGEKKTSGADAPGGQLFSIQPNFLGLGIKLASISIKSNAMLTIVAEILSLSGKRQSLLIGKDTFPAFKLEGIESCALSSCDILLRL